jgi:ParB family transcriptional regulator, chromosome partitioning protein
MIKKPVLGRELESLLKGMSTSLSDQEENHPENSFYELPIEQLKSSRFQPRQNMNEESLAELAESIKAQGIIQPIVVRYVDDDHYEVIAGERRWRAAQKAGLKKVPVLVRDLTDQMAFAIALIENLQREDLNPLEEALALQKLVDEFQLTHGEVAQHIGKSRTTVTNLLRLLNLQEAVKELLSQGHLEMGHARALLSLENARQEELAQWVVEHGLSVRETEEMVQEWLNSAASSDDSTKSSSPAVDSCEHHRHPIDPDVKRLEQHLSEKLGTTVFIQHKKSGKGRLIIKYTSLDVLEGILEHING